MKNRLDDFFWMMIYAPAVVVIPFLIAKIPLNYQPAREIAGYYQSLGLLELGLKSFLVLTPSESFSSIHLHSILSSPFLFFGYKEGGRFVSFIGALIAVTVIALLGSYLFDLRAALFAPLLLWLNPLFMVFSYAYQPEALSIGTSQPV